jgi:hypothetical protein
LKDDKRKEVYKLIEASKYNPVIGAERLLNLDLPYHQQDMLKRGWTHKFPIYLCSRRTGKTFVMAIMSALKGSLYPQIKIGIVAPVFRQAKTVFLEIVDLIKRSPFLQAQIDGEPKRGASEWTISFKNGSIITALPLSDNIRSKGFNFIIIDEYGYGDNMNQMVGRIIEPMAFTKREIKVNGDVHPTDIGNQLLIASTATFKFNDYYKKLKEYEEKMDEGKDQHDIISYDYRDGLESGIFEKEQVIEKFENSDSLTQKMEYLNIFPDDEGSFISYELLQKYAIDTEEQIIKDEDGEVKNVIPPKTQVEFEQETDEQGNPTHEYILAFDDADVGDNFAIAMIKMDGSTKRIVRIVAMNSVPIQEKIIKIRELLRHFNIARIVCDQRHKNIKDNLAKPYRYSDGSKGKIILDRDDLEQEKYVNREYPNTDTEKLIKVHNFAGSTNEMRAKHLLGEIENGRVKFPAPVGAKSKQEEDTIEEFKKTWSEIASIQATTNGKYIKFSTPSRTMKKDRWTVTELGVYMADEYQKESTKRNNDVYMGGWNTGNRRGGVI